MLLKPFILIIIMNKTLITMTHKVLLLGFLLNSSFFFSQSISEHPVEAYSKAPFGAYASGETEKEILRVIDQFMIAVNTKDQRIFDKILYPDINRIVTNFEENGSTTTVIIDNDVSISKRMNPKNPNAHRERYWDAKIITDGAIASVWAPYDFYLNGLFSHCGVDLFYLVKNKDTWKIAHFGYTRNKKCK